jgi:hypothetical protein
VPLVRVCPHGACVRGGVELRAPLLLGREHVAISRDLQAAGTAPSVRSPHSDPDAWVPSREWAFTTLWSTDTRVTSVVICAVLSCSREGSQVFEMPKLGDEHRRAFLCPQHHSQVVNGEVEWRWQVQGPDSVTGPAGIGDVMLIGKDLLPLNEWVVDHFGGFDLWSTTEAASDPRVNRRTWTIVARRRGTASAEELRLVMTPEQFQELVRFKG